MPIGVSRISLLIATGTDIIGDVQIVATGQPLPLGPDTVQLDRGLTTTRFADLLEQAHIARKPPTLAGVQDKASAAMISLPLKQQHERYILKLNPPEYPHLVENEHHFLTWSRTAGIPTTAARIIRDTDNEPGLLVTRFDRVNNAGATTPLAVEDAAQALDVWPADKYNVTLEQAARALMNLSHAPLITARGILQQLLYAWLSGNGDLHAKNLSVLTTTTADTRLTPAYDVPSTLYYGDTTLALTVAGRDTLTIKRVQEFSTSLGLPAAATHRIIGAILTKTAGLIDSLDALPFDRRTTSKVARQLTTRRRDIEHGIG